MASSDSLVILCFVGFMACVAIVALTNTLEEFERKREIEQMKKEKVLLAKLNALLKKLRR